MFNLQDLNISYIIITPDRDYYQPSENKALYESICTVLYSKDYTIIPIKSYLNGLYENSLIAISSIDNNDDLRFDSIFLMDKFKQTSAIVKYKGEKDPVRINESGNEKLLNLSIYDSNVNNKMFIYNGVSFTFTEKKRYFFPKKKEDLKNGMIIEYFNNNKWTTKEIFNIETEWDKMFKLLTKYEKLRIECN